MTLFGFCELIFIFLFFFLIFFFFKTNFVAFYFWVICVLTVYVDILLTDEINVTFTERVLLYVAKCWSIRGHLSLKQQYIIGHL